MTHAHEFLPNFSRYFPWTGLLKALVCLTSCKGQLLSIRDFRRFFKARIRALTPECDLIRMQKSESIVVLLQKWVNANDSSSNSVGFQTL